MVKMSQKSRDTLIEMLRVERSALRCEISKELHAESKPIRVPFDEEIKDIQGVIRDLENDILFAKSMRHDALSQLNLLEFDEYDRYNSCRASELHPRLKEFDEESNTLKKEILLM